MAKDKETISTNEKNAKLRAENMAKKIASDKAVRAASPVGEFQDRMKAIDEEQRFPGLKQAASASSASGVSGTPTAGTPPEQTGPTPYRHPLPYRKTFMEQANNFDWSNRGPAAAEATRMAAMKQIQDMMQTQGGQKITMPLSTGEMIPSIASRSPTPSPAPSRPIDLTDKMQRPAFDTATTNRLQSIPGAYEEAVKRLVPQRQMTLTANGQQYTAQPPPRWDRMELQRFIASKQLEQQKSIADADLQKGRDAQMAMARIPIELQKERNAGGLEIAKLAKEQADLENKYKYENNPLQRQLIEEQIADIQQKRGQADATFKDTQARKLTPEQETSNAGLDEIIRQRASSPGSIDDDVTKAAITQLLESASPAAKAKFAASSMSRPAQLDAAKAEGMKTIMSDPQLLALVEKVKESKPGLLTGEGGRYNHDVNVRLLDDYANRISRSTGLTSNDVLTLLYSMTH